MPTRNPESLKGLSGIGKKKTKKQPLYKTRQAREKAGQKLTATMERKRLARHIQELDRLHSKKIRDKYKKCFTCEAKTDHNGHFLSRKYREYRRDDKNCHGQCYGCNVGKNGNYIVYTQKMIEKYGQEFVFNRIDKVNDKRYKNTKPRLERLKEQILSYK